MPGVRANVAGLYGPEGLRTGWALKNAVVGVPRERDAPLTLSRGYRERLQERVGRGIQTDLARAALESEPLSASELAEVPIEGTQRQVTCLPGNLQDQAIRESQRRPLAKTGRRTRHCI